MDSFIKLIDLIDKNYTIERIKLIVEVGARDCCESVLFTEAFPNAIVHTFECNPETLDFCEKNIVGNPRIILNKKAVINKPGIISFYQIDTDKTETSWLDGNPGASGVFQASGAYDHIEKYQQKEILVEAIRLDEYFVKNNIEHVDLLWMDAQGAEKLVLDGAGAQINKIAMIHCEVEFFEIYKGQVLFPELSTFLGEKGFIFIGFTNKGEYAGDAVFVNAKNIKDKQIERMKQMLTIKRKTILQQMMLKKLGHAFDLRIKPKLLKIRNMILKKVFSILKIMVIQHAYDGLGDHLFYSHLPEIAKKLGYKKIFISKKNKYRSKEIEDIVWKKNPYISGFVNFWGIIIDEFVSVEDGKNILDEVMLRYNLDDGIRYHEPRVYINIVANISYKDSIVYDPNYITYVGKINKNKVEDYFTQKKISVSYQMCFREKFVPIHNFEKFKKTKTLLEYCELIVSCKEFYCLSSGGATLAIALGVKPNVFWGNGQKNMFRHSKFANYIQV